MKVASSRVRTSLGAGPAALVFAAALTSGAVAVSPDALVERSFAAALSSPAEPSRVAAANPYSGISGTEDFWLSRNTGGAGAAVQPVTWSAPVAVGERIVVTRGGENKQVLDVLAIEPVDDGTTRIENAATGTGRFSVTCRDALAQESTPITLTIDASGSGVTRIIGGLRGPQAL